MDNGKKENGKTRLVIIVIGAVVGLLLLFLGNGDTFEREETLAASNSSVYDEALYEEELVNKIEGVCKKVRGAGEVKVAVTLDGSYRAVYAQNLAAGENSRREYFLVGSGSSEKALLLGYSPPEILGVAIVCEGGENKGVRAEIISLVSALLDLPTNKIYVAGGK